VNWVRNHLGLIVVCAIGGPLCVGLVLTGHYYGYIVAGFLGWAAAIYDLDNRPQD